MYDYDLIVVGGGPAGYVAAIRGSQLGLKTAVMEREHMGGTCLNVGCIPTKALYQTAKLMREIARGEEFGVRVPKGEVDFPAVIARKDRVVSRLVGGVRHLMKKYKVDVITENAAFADPHTLTGAAGKRYTAKFILIATGSHNSLPPIPGIDGKNVIDSTEALSLKELPEELVIVGGGVIGAELGNIFAAFGSKVTILEMLPLLIRGTSQTCEDSLEMGLKDAGVRVELSAAVKRIEDRQGRKLVTFEKDGTEQSVQAQYVLVATGRAPTTGALALEKAGVKTAPKGWIEVNDRMQTNVTHIYAAGDVTGRGMLAHTAYEAGSVAVENMAGHDRAMSFDAVPKVVFTAPEISWVGMTEEEATQAGFKPITGVFSMAANGKALAEGETEGFVKVVSESEYHRVLGVQIVGASASEIVTTAASLIAQECGLEDVAATIYPHPSVSEALREACLVALGQAIHS